MRVVLSFAAALVSLLLPPADARAEGGGLAADAAKVPWARFQGRIGYSPGAQGWRADLAPLERSGLQVSSLGLLSDLYVFGGGPDRARSPAVGFRATSGVIIGSRSPLLGTASTPSTNGVLAGNRRLFGAPASALASSGEAGVDAATLPYIGIGYNNLSVKSGWSFSADLGVVSQSPANAVRFGRVFGGPQNLDDVIRDMRLAPVVQLGVSYSF